MTGVNTEPNSPPLDELLERASRLEAGALAQIHDRFYPEVYRYIHFRLEDEATSAQLTEQVFLRFVPALHQRLIHLKNVDAWLLDYASKLVKDSLRQHYQRPRHRLKEKSVAKNENEQVNPPTTDANPELFTLKRDIRLALARLTLEQQHLLALRFAQERSIEDTTNILGNDLNQVKEMQIKALIAFRRFLG